MTALAHGIAQVLVDLVAGLLGPALTLVWTPSKASLAYVQHFAAGTVTAAAAVELFPEIERSGAPGWVTLAGFAAGGLAMALLSHGNDKLEARWNGATGLFLATGIDLLLDGGVLGATLVLGGRVATAVAVGLGTEFLFVTLSLGGALRHAGMPRVHASGLAVSVTLAFLVGVVAGALVLSAAGSRALAAVLAFGAAVLLYLAAEELMVEAHKEPTIRPLSTVLYFLGFLALLAFRVVA